MVRAEISARLVGEVVRKRFATKGEAEAWVEKTVEHVQKLGRSKWKPDRFALIELEQMHLARDEAVLAGLKVPSLLDLVKHGIGELRLLHEKAQTPFSRARAEWLESISECSKEYRRHCRRISRYFEEFVGSGRIIAEVNFKIVDDWLKTRPKGSKYSDARTMSTMWGWCANPRRGYVEANPWIGTGLKPAVKGEPQRLELAEITCLLRCAAAEPGQPLLPFLIITLFCGPRVAECERLDWSDIQLEPGGEGVLFRYRITKKKHRRWIVLPPVAAAWLRFYSGRRAGRVAPPSIKFRRARLHAKAGFIVQARVSNNSKSPVLPIEGVTGRPYPRNGLRDSYCTYVLAHTHDLEEVAFCAGTSPRMIREHYDGGATPSEGKAYHELFPERVLAGQADCTKQCA